MSGIARSATKDLVFFSSRRRHTRYWRDWSSDVCSSDLGVLVADRLVRSMWRHAIFTGPHQWRTVALILTVLWIMIGAVAAVALLGPPEEQEVDGTNGQRAGEVGAHGRAPVQPDRQSVV